jgi:hypothetical protein
MLRNKYLMVFFALLLLLLISLLFVPVAFFLENNYFHNDEKYRFRDSDGTFIQGRTTLEVADTFGEISWKIDDLDLINLEPTTDIIIKNQYASVTGQLILNTDDIHLKDTSGILTKDGFNTLLEKLGANTKVVNGFEINNVNIFHSTGYFLRANGTLNWDGGIVKLNQQQEIVLPAMIGKMSTYHDGIRLRIFQKENSLILGEIDLSDDGIAHFKFMERFGEFIPMVPNKFMKGNPNAIMFEIKQAI